MASYDLQWLIHRFLTRFTVPNIILVQTASSPLRKQLLPDGHAIVPLMGTFYLAGQYYSIQALVLPLSRWPA